MTKYWESGETPTVIDALQQRFKYYRIAGVFEISTLKEDETGVIEIRRQVISTKKLYANQSLCDMFMLFLEDAGLIAKKEEGDSI